MMLEHKTALITGAARGIGKAIALRFAKEGCNIAFTDLVLNDNAETTLNEIRQLGVKAEFYAADASKFDQAHDIVKQVVADFGQIDILVNNAGITRDGLLLRMTEQQWDDVITINLKSAYNYTHACAPFMMKARKGSIISLSSVVGVSGNAGQANYAASKAGIIGLTKSVAKELGPRGIRANAIAPGFIDTDMTKALPANIREEWVKMIPLRRAGSTEDVANAALFLASDLSAYISGQVIHVCGAMNC
ncbi:MAG: 3-oxoacyl-[Paludibacteraceae bacterium]|nr:3-oxoacyl-[acyl-carrier-protein] reductase [Paludibacteraceae bacterium]